MSRYVLDATTLIAAYKGEPGADRVRSLIGGSAISVVNLHEVAEYIVRLGGGRTEVEAALGPLAIEVHDADHLLALEAAYLTSFGRHVGLSLGDRFCLALAMRLERTALTGDRAWLKVADRIGVRIELFR